MSACMDPPACSLGPRQKAHHNYLGRRQHSQSPCHRVMNLTHPSQLLSTLPHAHFRTARVTHPETPSCQLPCGWGLGKAHRAAASPCPGASSSCAVSVARSNPFPNLVSAPSYLQIFPEKRSLFWCFPDVQPPRQWPGRHAGSWPRTSLRSRLIPQGSLRDFLNSATHTVVLHLEHPVLKRAVSQKL